MTGSTRHSPGGLTSRTSLSKSSFATDGVSGRRRRSGQESVGTSVFVSVKDSPLLLPVYPWPRTLLAMINVPLSRSTLWIRADARPSRPFWWSVFGWSGRWDRTDRMDRSVSRGEGCGGGTVDDEGPSDPRPTTHPWSPRHPYRLGSSPVVPVAGEVPGGSWGCTVPSRSPSLRDSRLDVRTRPSTLVVRQRVGPVVVLSWRCLDLFLVQGPVRQVGPRSPVLEWPKLPLFPQVTGRVTKLFVVFYVFEGGY